MSASTGLGHRIQVALPRVPAHWLRRSQLMLARFAARRRQRQALAVLDARLLRDVGITPDQARAEAAKPFWRA